MEDKRWVDFKAVKETVTMEKVLAHYGITNLKRNDNELRGPCPIHQGNARAQSFSVNIFKNVFKCFSCGSRGNVLDFVAMMEECTVKDAALKLAEWFKVGESNTAMTNSGNAAERAQVLPGIYEHFKGNRYLVTGVALHSETGEPLVIYRALYGDYILSARPVSMFTETVERGEYIGPRFKFIQPV
jgi:hypothetical protein